MKIAIFSDCYLDLTGGIVTSINAQKTALETNGHKVYVFSTSYSKTAAEKRELAKKNIFPVPSCRIVARGIAPISRRPGIIEKWLLREHPELKEFDIFYIHYESGCSIAGLRLGKKLHIPTIQVMHGREDMGVSSIVPFGCRTLIATLLNWFHSWYIPHPLKVHCDNYLANTIAKAKMWTMMVNHANYADCLVCPSRHFAEKLAHYGVKREFHIVPNGYPDANFPSSPSLKQFTGNKTLKMIWHCRLSGEKRIMAFLEALTHVDGKYRLDVYGGGPDAGRAKRYAARHHLNVFFHGTVAFSEFQSVLQNSHLDILVSYNFDNYPLTLVEAEANGVPCLICDPDMREIIPGGGFIQSSNETPRSIASAINELFLHPEKVRNMSSIMLKHRQEVLISKRIKTLENVFRDIKHENPTFNNPGVN